MNAYILSNDIYFAIGLVELLSRVGYTSHILNSSEKIAEYNLYHKTTGIIFIDVSDGGKMIGINSDEHPLVRFVFVADHFNNDVELNSKNSIPIFIKKSSINQTISWLKWFAERTYDYRCNYSKLSQREFIVINHLIKGESQRIIANKMSVSVKTISAHKWNALNKLGVRRMSCRSLSYINNYISRCLIDLKVSR
ncbi:response regulator transcription factor [Yokenella regensburgei]|uniref:response regulator transcription factor n=1 Tax=Yokenella regensburgei TaxID=158877 RepID=UPI001433294C|nr:LuxR C-terminal-related transcriptional regulator [Yokenella regensburgei]QIU88430.1 response regulator transcription factor [Yokenella regensburgei]